MRSGTPALLVLAAVLVAVEAIGAVGAAVLLLVEIATAPADSLPSAIALVVLAVVLALGLAAAAVGLLRRRPWSRAVAIVWQILQLAVGISALTGAGSRPAFGWPLIALALVLLGLVFSPPVVAATRERARE